MKAFSKISEEWNEYRQTPSKTALLLLKYKRDNSELICDVGCGNGRNSLVLAKLTKKLICIDSSKEMLDFARINLKKFDNVEFVNSKMQEIDGIKKNSVDNICCFAAFHHLKTKKDRINALEQFYRILKPQGRVLLSVWHPKMIIKEKNQMVNWKKEDGNKIKRYYHFFESAEIKELFESTKFSKVIVFGEINGKEVPIENSMNICVIAQK